MPPSNIEKPANGIVPAALSNQRIFSKNMSSTPAQNCLRNFMAAMQLLGSFRMYEKCAIYAEKIANEIPPSLNHSTMRHVLGVADRSLIVRRPIIELTLLIRHRYGSATL